jgi:hypothetical protein
LLGPITGHLARGGGIVGDTFAHHLSVNSDPAFASDGHAIQTQLDAWLAIAQVPFVVESEFGHAFESNQVKDGTFIDKGAINLVNFELGGDLATPGSQWAIADLQVLDLHKLPLFPLQPFPERITQRFDFVHVPVLVPTSELGQSKDQDNQSALQHESSVSSSSATLSRHRWLVKKWGKLFMVGIHKIEEWQGSFSCGIVTACGKIILVG